MGAETKSTNTHDSACIYTIKHQVGDIGNLDNFHHHPDRPHESFSSHKLAAVHGSVVRGNPNTILQPACMQYGEISYTTRG
jgi:hypothetical protein